MTIKPGEADFQDLGMSFEDVFTDELGQQFPPQVTNVLVQCVTEALVNHPDVNPDCVILTARRVGRRAVAGNHINDLERYARLSLARSARRDEREEREKAKKFVFVDGERINSLGAIDTRWPSVDFSESTQLVEKCLEHLSERDRLVFLLHEYMDLDHAAVAATLHISRASSWFRLNRARKILRKVLTETFPGQSIR